MNKIVVIDNKQQPISFNMAAILECEQVLDVSLDTILFQADSITADQYTKLAYLGLKYGCDEFSRKVPMTYSAFVELVNRDNTIITSILEIVFKDIETIFMLQAEKIKLNTPKEEVAEKKSEEFGSTTSIA